MNAWQQLEPRQRRLIGLAGLVLVVALVYVWIWEPLAEAREAERERIAQQQALLNWLETVAPMAERLRENSRSSRDLDGRSLLGLADETARAAGLAGAMARIEPTGDDEVRVWLEGADFVKVMGWLEAFSRSRPVQVDQLQVDTTGDEGQVNVRVTLISNA
ncbi:MULTISPECIES: type II secretion system protein GspM [unclassified Wenzhouxiangella]|uniref:type II secretion system protein GspM n=1 Tax=unclassified Wenzhouxiangella TaxID=2613841 RepID=UPI000E3262E2|nr:MULTISPECIES: type II secretion system protein M [unclassified Wenzhouxiangella]RFF28505.1 type II secretion system protein M [Wenzhouxiangella sp. 15181]RFP70023.1 type II secretion system protein M [Wenzhouxiangella sp. 15190]